MIQRRFTCAGAALARLWAARDPFMSERYRALIGREFLVDGVRYTITDTVREDRRDFAEALPSVVGAHAASSHLVRVPMATVLDALLVEEEIVLYQATFLGAADTTKAAS